MWWRPIQELDWVVQPVGLRERPKSDFGGLFSRHCGRTLIFLR
jgi:hypothetical protein